MKTPEERMSFSELHSQVNMLIQNNPKAIPDTILSFKEILLEHGGSSRKILVEMDQYARSLRREVDIRNEIPNPEALANKILEWKERSGQ